MVYVVYYVASGNQEKVQACLVTLWLFIRPISCHSLYKTTIGSLCSWKPAWSLKKHPHSMMMMMMIPVKMPSWKKSMNKFTTRLIVIAMGDKQRVLMHGHQGWNVRHGLCHIYMRYVYIWVVYSLCFFCCLFITVTWWYVWCIECEWASGNQEEVQACLVTLWPFIISCYSLYKTTLGLLCSWFENNPHFHKYSMDFHV